MAHTDLLIFFNTAFWVFILFLVIYFFILVVFSSNTYFRVRIFSLHRVFLMATLLSFFQLGVVLSKMLQYFLVSYQNLFFFKNKLLTVMKRLNNILYSSAHKNIIIPKFSLITTFFSFLN